MTQPKKPSKRELTFDDMDDDRLGWNHAIDEMDAYYQPIVDELVRCLMELHSIVKGESPSLLDEGSGGDVLDYDIEQALAKYKALK